MPLIKILSTDLRNKIAAGEVVERPASVVKELIENSIDAQSTVIRIEVLYAGKRIIKVSDNGIGMDKEDALLCFERHATSKIENESDLFNIKTMGFRGEALPSIASVSRVKLITVVKDSSSGISIELLGGEKKEIKDSPFSGTSVEVRDLFFNTHARKKFLKTNTTELFHIIDTVTKETLSHPEIGFTLMTENQETILLPKASGFRERIMQIYGDGFVKGLIEIINPPHPSFRKGGHSSLAHAVYNAYEGILPKDKHPIFFLFLEFDPKKVDFNVHPTKREVRFEDKEGIYRFVNMCIRDAVKGERKEFIKQFAAMPAYMPAETAHYEPAISQTASAISEDLEFVYKPSLPFIYLGDTFIAVSGKGGLTLIDHHAAHERILYERFLKKINLDSHQLLFPQQIKLSHKEYKVILENKNLLYEFGIDVDDFGHDTLIIRSLPDALNDADLREQWKFGTHPLFLFDTGALIL